MKVHQLYTYSSLRNYSYVFCDESNRVYCIDPTDADLIIKFLKSQNMKLDVIINTHEHYDHIAGNETLVNTYGCEVWAHENAQSKIKTMTRGLKDGERIDLGNDESLTVLDTPGHTFSHVCLLYQGKDQQAVFTGDTLFNAGVGNCHNGGDPETLFKTVLEKLSTLDDEVLVYPGHDYWKNNLEFTLHVEGENTKAKELLYEYNQDPEILNNADFKTSTLGLEKEINTFLRLGEKNVTDGAQRLGDFTNKELNDKNVFLTLRELRNRW